VEETGPDFVIRNMEDFLTGSKFCDLAFICDDNLAVSAHCSVVSAVSPYLRELLKEVYIKGENRDLVTIHLTEVTLEDMQHFLELVYTGRVSMSATRRPAFTSLLEILNVSDDIGEKVTYSNGVTSIGGGVTLTKVDRSKKTRPVPGSKKISVAITPVVSSPSSVVTNTSPRAPVPDLTPITVVKPEPPSSVISDTGGLSAHAQPPVESLLATLSHQLTSGNDGMAQAAADQATKEWLGTSKIGVPQMVMDGDTGQVSLAHSDAASGRKCEKCRCPLCMDPNRAPGEPAMHLCHYPNCGKVYKKTSHLRAHLRWHIGDQPYLCSWPGCSRKFTRSDELHRHFRIHTGERKHKCDHCGKSFSRSDHLKKHALSHHTNLNSSAITSHDVEYTDDNDNMETEIDPTQLLEVSSYQDEGEEQLNY